jgi:hypothetical protein
MKDLEEGTKIAAVSGMGAIEHAVILEKAESANSSNVYLVRWLSDGSSTLFEVTEENLIREGKKNVRKKRNNSRKSKKQSRRHSS